MNMPRLARAHDEAEMNALLSAGIDMRMAAEAMQSQSESVAVLARGLSPDGILQAETKALDANGIGECQSHVPAHSIAVVNLGTSVLTVSNGGSGSAPPGPGKGTLKVLPGQMICTPLIGMAHQFWGRAGELFTVVRYKTLQPFAAADVGGSYHVVNLGTLVVGVPTVVYTTPWGDPAYYGGLSVRDTTAVAGSSDASELLVADGNGVELDSANFSGKESTEDTSARPKLATSPKIVVTLVKGAVAGELFVW